jgi:PatG Domain
VTEDREGPQETTESVAIANADDPAVATRADVTPSTPGPGPLIQPAPATTFVYALGRIEPRFPTLAVEKEFAQVAGREDTKGLTDRQALSSLLGERPNRYLARELCWVFTIEGLETYVLTPRDPADFDRLIEAVRPSPRPTDVDVVIGLLGPLAPPEACNGLMVPVVAFDNLYSFDVDSLVKSVPRPKGIKSEEFEPIAEELFMRIVQMADNAGSTDADRALNYLSVRYPTIYHAAAERIAADSTLSSVDVRPSPLSGVRTIVDVILAWTNRTTDVTEKDLVRVDVTEKYPFLVTKLVRYLDRDA